MSLIFFFFLIFWNVSTKRPYYSKEQEERIMKILLVLLEESLKTRSGMLFMWNSPRLGQIMSFWKLLSNKTVQLSSGLVWTQHGSAPHVSWKTVDPCLLFLAPCAQGWAAWDWKSVKCMETRENLLSSLAGGFWCGGRELQPTLAAGYLCQWELGSESCGLICVGKLQIRARKKELQSPLKIMWWRNTSVILLLFLGF